MSETSGLRAGVSDAHCCVHMLGIYVLGLQAYVPESQVGYVRLLGIYVLGPETSGLRAGVSDWLLLCL
eukprot:6473466-Amphidinium_carterae.1